MAGWLPLPLALALALAGGTPLAAGDLLPAIQRLSFDLRERRPSEQERKEIEEALARGQTPDEIFRAHVDRWLGRAFYARAMPSFFLGFPPLYERIFLELVRQKDPGGGPFALALKGAPACAASDVVEVHPWWAPNTRVLVCADSHRPDRVFDASGYCSGQDPNTQPLIWRSGCGCGPFLIGCIPPKDELPDMGPKLNLAMAEEVIGSAADIVTQDRPLDELMTTGPTFRSGLVDFIYLRREILTEIKRQGWSQATEDRFLPRLREIDLSAPAAWKERAPMYQGTGLFYSTAAASAEYPGYRQLMRLLYDAMLCTEFNSIRVDSDSMLRAVHADEKTIRANTALATSPMRNQPGCRGCHVPLDHAGAFLVTMQTSLWGSIATGLPGDGRLYIRGPEDFRGQGAGPAAFSALVVKQKEFEDCAVKRAYTAVFRRPPPSSQREMIAELGAGFRANHHHWSWVVKSLLLSDTYRTSP